MYEIYKPQSELLKKYVTEITVLKKGYKKMDYFAFPHITGFIAFSFFSKIKYDNNNNHLKVIKTTKAEPKVVSFGKYMKPIRLSYYGETDEIVIYFTKTGVNYFFDNNYCDIAPLPFQILKNKVWQNFSIILVNTIEKDRIKLIESFLESEFRVKDLNTIEKSINKLAINKSKKLKDIAAELNISEKTLNRLFHKYVGCSPKNFKKIYRFRGAINDYNLKDFNLTQLCLENEYYDSSHFVKEFKKLTGEKPSSYFNKLTFMNNNMFPYILE